MIRTVLISALILLSYMTSAQSTEVTEIAIEDAPREIDDQGRILKKNGKYGIITSNGIERVPAKYDSLIEISSSKIIARKNAKAGVITRDEKIVVPFNYDNITRLKDSYIFVKTEINGRQGITSTDGEVIIAPGYDDIIWNRGANFFLVKAGRKVGVVSSDGNVLLEPITADHIPNAVWDKRKVRYFYFIVGEQWGLASIDGKVLIPAKYGHLHYMEEHELFLAQSIHGGKTFEILDEANNVIVPMRDLEFMVSPNFIIVKEGGKYGATNVLNKQVVPFGKYDDMVCTIAADCTPRVMVRLNGKRGLMDENGELLTEIIYTSLTYKAKGCFIEYKLDQKSGLLDQSGKTIIEDKFKGFVIWTSAERILASDESGVRLYNFQGKELTPHVFEKIERIGSEKFFSFIQKGKWGLINTEGEIVVKPEFDKIFEKRSTQSDIFGQQNGRRVLLKSE